MRPVIEGPPPVPHPPAPHCGRRAPCHASSKVTNGPLAVRPHTATRRAYTYYSRCVLAVQKGALAGPLSLLLPPEPLPCSRPPPQASLARAFALLDTFRSSSSQFRRPQSKEAGQREGFAASGPKQMALLCADSPPLGRASSTQQACALGRCSVPSGAAGGQTRKRESV